MNSNSSEDMHEGNQACLHAINLKQHKILIFQSIYMHRSVQNFEENPIAEGFKTHKVSVSKSLSVLQIDHLPASLEHSRLARKTLHASFEK